MSKKLIKLLDCFQKQDYTLRQKIAKQQIYNHNFVCIGKKKGLRVEAISFARKREDKVLKGTDVCILW